MLYFAFHAAAFAGVPVTIPARRQYFVFIRAGAIWFVLRLPRPTSAKPSFLSWGGTLRILKGSPRMAPPAPRRAVVRRKSLRDCDMRIASIDDVPTMGAGAS